MKKRLTHIDRERLRAENQFAKTNVKFKTMSEWARNFLLICPQQQVYKYLLDENFINSLCEAVKKCELDTEFNKRKSENVDHYRLPNGVLIVRERWWKQMFRKLKHHIIIEIELDA